MRERVTRERKESDDDGKIRFRNKPFMARVFSDGDGPVSCTPVVYDEFRCCGVGIFINGDRGHIWGPVVPRDLIAAWRGTEVLRRLNTISQRTLCAAYYSGVRNPNESDLLYYVKPTIAIIGREAYDEIMSMPVPEQIVRAILDNQKDDFPPSLFPITDEILAGTIRWRQEFADNRIIHPYEINPWEGAKKETIAGFEMLLDSYARSHDVPRRCMEMWDVERALLALVDKNANMIHHDSVLVALAGVVGSVASENEKQAFNHSAVWLVSKPLPVQSRIFFWRRQQQTLLTRGGADELLRRLFLEYFLPVNE